MARLGSMRCTAGGLGDLNGLGRLPTLPGPDLNLPDLNAPEMSDLQALQVRALATTPNQMVPATSFPQICIDRNEAQAALRENCCRFSRVCKHGVSHAEPLAVWTHVACS